MKKLLVLFLGSIVLFSCESKVQKIVDRAIEVHGGKDYENCHLEFDFRDMHYDFERKNGQYIYQRIQTDSSGNTITDILTNTSFSRLINGEKSDLPDTTAAKFSNSVNSVAYFLFLPNGLNDASVNKEWTREVEIVGKKYDEIKVTFDEEGGGNDHQDVFLFWINQDTGMMDYLAYSYETSGGGVRFRESIRQHRTGSFLFQDYNNYGLEDQNYPLDQLPTLFEKGDLPLLSSIENENLTLKK